MIRNFLLRHLLYSHIAGSYAAAFVAAATASGFHVSTFLGFSFPIFLAPLIFPFLLMIETQQQNFVCGSIYAAVFLANLVYLRRQYARSKVLAQARFDAVQAEPNAPISLEYMTEGKTEAEPCRKTELIAFGSGALAIIALITVIFVGISREDSGWPSLGPRIMWLVLLAIPGLIAVITGLIGCFKTKPHTRPRFVALLGLCLGILVAGLMLSLIYSYLTGLDQYD
jgi:hypothetical protein